MVRLNGYNSVSPFKITVHSRVSLFKIHVHHSASLASPIQIVLYLLFYYLFLNKIEQEFNFKSKSQVFVLFDNNTSVTNRPTENSYFSQYFLAWEWRWPLFLAMYALH